MNRAEINAPGECLGTRVDKHEENVALLQKIHSLSLEGGAQSLKGILGALQEVVEVQTLVPL